MAQNTWRILVIEDDPDGQEVVATILAHLNIPLDVAGNATEAEHYLYQTRNEYNAIIVDLALPDKDGWEILAGIQAHPKTANVPCVAVTAYHTSKLREQALTAGFTAYFAKPIDATSFARQLEAIL